MGEPLFDRALPPDILLNGRLACLLDRLGEGHQPLGGVRAPVQQHVLHKFEQILGDLLVHRKLPGVDDPHVEAGADRVIQEGGVHCLAHRVVAAERERDVAHAPADLTARQRRLDPAGRLDEGHGVVVVLLDAGGDGQDVRIEDDVLRREADLLGQDAVCPRADLDLAVQRVGLSHFIERHDDHGGAVPFDQPRMAREGLLALLQADRVDDALALHALEPGFDHLPFGAVDHDRHAGDVRLGRDEPKERAHGLLRVQHGFVHVHINDLGPAVHLLPGYGERAFVVAAQDQLGKRGRAGDVGPFPDVDEVCVRADGHRLEAAQARIRLDGRRDMRRPIPDSLGNCLNVSWRGPATPAHDVEPASLRELAQVRRHDLRRLIEAAKGVRQPSVRVTTDEHRRDARQLFEVRPHLLRAERAVDPDAQQRHVGDRIPERLHRLAGERASASVRDRDRDHDRHAPSLRLEMLVDGEQRGL